MNPNPTPRSDLVDNTPVQTSDAPRLDRRALTLIERLLTEGKPVRRRLPDGGRLHIDRALPFLCVYRESSSSVDAGTHRLVTGEASYLTANADLPLLSELVEVIARCQSAQFGAFLLVEVWAKPDSTEEADHRAIAVVPVIEVHRPPLRRLDPAIDRMVRRLRQVRVQKKPLGVEVISSPSPIHRAGFGPLLSREIEQVLQCSSIGLAIPPVYRDEAGDPSQQFPQVLRHLRRGLGLALRRAFFEFARTATTHRPPHYHELGRRAVVKSVWDVDRRLSEVSEQFLYLLNVTPVNTHSAWQEFESSGFDKTPEFHYLPLEFEPSLLKRDLYRIPIERVEDPALADIFQERQAELDRQITLLADRNTPRFLLGSRQLYGSIEPQVIELATRVLEEEPPSPCNPRTEPDWVEAPEFAALAGREIAAYHRRAPDFDPDVEVTSKVAGVMVSRGRLLIGDQLRVSRRRVDALLQHEIGIHLVTYYNGFVQPLRQLRYGLAGYEQLQEGLAVLAEFLVGGLTYERVRQLAGRVVAVRSVEAGASFLESFRLLTEKYGFVPRAAFNVVTRVHRGGGFTKDAIYLRGVDQVLKLLQQGVDLDLMLAGKMAASHIGVIHELQLRGVLSGLALRPLFLDRPEALGRLQRWVSSESSVLDLLMKSIRTTCSLDK